MSGMLAEKPSAMVRLVAEREVVRVLLVEDVGAELLALDLLLVAPIVLVCGRVAGREAELPFPGQQVRAHALTEQRAVLPDQHAPLRARRPRRRHQPDSEHRHIDQSRLHCTIAEPSLKGETVASGAVPDRRPEWTTRPD